MKRFAFVALLALMPALAFASPISIYNSPGASQNGDVNPCVFSGQGGNGCNQLDFAFPTWVDSTQQFDTNPLVNTYGDAPGELAQFGALIGRSFYLGLDINEGGPVQTLTDLTITFRDANGNVLGSGYQFGPTPVNLPVTQQGEGYTDYTVAAGCTSGLVPAPGLNSTCTNYAPFIAPINTRSLTFTFGMGTFNDGAERLYLVSAGANGVPDPFIDDEPPVGVPDGGATAALLGFAMVGLGLARQKFI